MSKADKKAYDHRFDIDDSRFLYGDKPIVIVECVEEKTDNRVEFARILVTVDQEDQDQEFYNCRQTDSIDPIQNRVA